MHFVLAQIEIVRELKDVPPVSLLIIVIIFLTTNNIYQARNFARLQQAFDNREANIKQIMGTLDKIALVQAINKEAIENIQDGLSRSIDNLTAAVQPSLHAINDLIDSINTLIKTMNERK